MMLPYDPSPKTHFSDVLVDRYLGVQDLHLEDLRRVNILVGPNDVGKTSVLEAVHVLASQCDVNSLLDTVRYRTRCALIPRDQRLLRLLPPEGRVSGCFNGEQAEVTWRSSTRRDAEDRYDIIGALELEATYGEHRSKGRIAVFVEGGTSVEHCASSRILCRSRFTSPIPMMESDLLSSRGSGAGKEVLNILRNYLRPEIESVERDKDGYFMVTENGRSLELYMYGEGMQRVFLLGSLMHCAGGGVFLIDGFENSVHENMIRPLVQLINTISANANIQVFVTTNNPEVIEAWADPDVADDVACYSLKPKQAPIRVEGSRLSRLVQNGFNSRVML